MTLATTEAIEPEEVHLWVASLEVEAGDIPPSEALLSEDERIRALRLRRREDRIRFVAARATVRRLLGAYLGLPPAELRFAYGPTGQPRLLASATDVDLRFNLSHSCDLLLVGVARGRSVGVDLEPVRSLPYRAAIERRVFSAGEQRTLSRLPAHRRTEAFFKGWTRKEAFAKATGDGMWATMGRVEVTLGPDDDARLLTLDGSREAAEHWTLIHVEPAAGFVGAAAIEGRDVVLRLLELEEAGGARR
jgi:4'-phosphopantetheinyl transferase